MSDNFTSLTFIDCETTGLGPEDEIWELAAVRRYEPDGAEYALHIQIEHDRGKADLLPPKFHQDYLDRYNPEVALPVREAADKIRAFLLPGVQIAPTRRVHQTHLVGANPAFDAAMLGRLLNRFDLGSPWHYHLIDLEAVTVGHMLARGTMPPIPWRSDDLAEALGLSMTDDDGNPVYDRHTAMGDVEWCRDWWDALNGVEQYVKFEEQPLVRNHSSWCPRHQSLEAFHHDQCIRCYDRGDNEDDE